MNSGAVVQLFVAPPQDVFTKWWFQLTTPRAAFLRGH
jgi:hypothetical protein